MGSLRRPIIPIPERMRPITASIAALTIGALLLVFSLDPDINPIGSGDLDGDSISDMYQNVDPVVEIGIDGSGGLVEERVGYSSSPDLPVIIFSSSLLLIVLPTTAYLYLWNRPRLQEERSRSKRSGIMHDSVRRMASFLEINPSLFYSIKCTIASQEAGDRPVLNSLLWESRCGGRSFGRVFSDFSDRCGRDDPLIGKALADLSIAETETSMDEVRRSARRSIDELSEDAGRKMSEYVESLKAPATALFAIGVLLPILLSTMIPLAGIENSTAWMLGILLWGVIPGGIVLFGNSMVRRRPRFRSDREIRNDVDLIRRIPGIALSIAGLVLFAASLVWAINGVNPVGNVSSLSGPELLILLMIDSAAMMAAGIAWSLTAGFNRSMKERQRLDEEVPSFLNVMGTALMEGSSFEGSLRKATSNTKGTLSDLSGMLSDPGGIQNISTGLPACISGIISSAYHFSRTGSEAGGQAVRALASHLRGMNNLDREMSRKIDGAVGQMEITASILAPLMIGGSVSIFHLLEATGMPGEGSMALVSMPASSSMSGGAFMILTGGYLLLLSLATTITLFRLRTGRDRGGWHRVPARLIQSAAAYSAGVILSVMIIG